MDQVEGSVTGSESKMKLWDILAMCFLLVSTISSSPLFPTAGTDRRPLSSTEVSIFPLLPTGEGDKSDSARSHRSSGEQHDVVLPPAHPGDVMDFIKATIRRIRRATEKEGRSQRQKQKDRRKGRGQHRTKVREREREKKSSNSGCTLKQIHLNVTDLGLGYQTKEELIFRYCSGPCVNSETNYDRILKNLTQNKKLSQDTPTQTCCRPIAYEDDLSFLDDNLTYHTLKMYSASSCACV